MIRPLLSYHTSGEECIDCSLLFCYTIVFVVKLKIWWCELSVACTMRDVWLPAFGRVHCFVLSVLLHTTLTTSTHCVSSVNGEDCTSWWQNSKMWKVGIRSFFYFIFFFISSASRTYYTKVVTFWLSQINLVVRLPARQNAKIAERIKEHIVDVKTVTSTNRWSQSICWLDTSRLCVKVAIVLKLL